MNDNKANPFNREEPEPAPAASRELARKGFFKNTPHALKCEPFRTWAIGGPVTGDFVCETLKITTAEFSILRSEGLLPPLKRCVGVYSRLKVVAFAWGLENSPILAETVEFLIGRRDPRWARRHEEIGE